MFIFLSDFITEVLSPVNIASFASRFSLDIILISADIFSPVSRITISPGTNRDESIICNFPSRRTVALGIINFLRSLIAFSARYCWKNPMDILMAIIIPITIASNLLSITKDTIAANNNMYIRGEFICPQRILIEVNFLFLSSLFLPYCSSLFLASSLESPFSLVSNSFKIVFLPFAQGVCIIYCV